MGRIFVDYVEVSLKAGKGGDGSKAFLREKYNPNGGPDGGDGGKGGDVLVKVNPNMRTLLDFRYKRTFVAENGQNGMKNSCYGKSAPDLVVEIPEGTTIKDAKTKKILADMISPFDVFVVKGGRGGRGNKHFKTSTRQAPSFAEAGYEGQSIEVIFELKSLADVGLVGYPSVGKSTILSVVTKAKPKIASYHFTTLVPNLGIAEEVKGKSFTIADIPGLIEGASDGVGLGYDFLRHVERTRVLLHIVDISGSEGRNVLEDFLKINLELKKYNEELSKREMIVVGNKIDLLQQSNEDNKKNADIFIDYLNNNGYKFFSISAIKHEGLHELMQYVTTRLDYIEKPKSSLIHTYQVEEEAENFEIIPSKIEEGRFELSGKGLYRLVYATDFDSREGVHYFEESLKKRGVIKELKALGFKDGDTLEFQGKSFIFSGV